MYKRLTVSAAVVLLLSCPVWADILQNQTFGIQGLNQAVVSGAGDLGIIKTQMIKSDNLQQATDAAGYATVIQGSNNTLFQGGGAMGMGGIFGFDQQGIGTGWQTQYQPSGLLMGTQNQDLTAGLGQTFTKIGGVGVVAGVQAFVGHQVQLNITPYGMTANAQSIGVVDYGAVSGDPASSTEFGGTIGVNVGQGLNP